MAGLEYSMRRSMGSVPTLRSRPQHDVKGNRPRAERGRRPLTHSPHTPDRLGRSGRRGSPCQGTSPRRERHRVTVAQARRLVHGTSLRMRGMRRRFDAVSGHRRGQRRLARQQTGEKAGRKASWQSEGQASHLETDGRMWDSSCSRPIERLRGASRNLHGREEVDPRATAHPMPRVPPITRNPFPAFHPPPVRRAAATQCGLTASPPHNLHTRGAACETKENAR